MQVFNNASVQAMIDEFGDRISCFIFDNKVPIFFGYSSSLPSVHDLELRTMGDVEVIGVPMKPKDPVAARKGGMFMCYHPTSFLQVIYVADAEHPDLRMDPFGLG